MSAVLTGPKYHIERIDGREIEKPTPKKLHAFVMSALMAELFKHDLSDLVVLPALDVLVGNGDRIVPDIVIVRRDAKYDNGMLAEPAMLAVEIMSSGQTFGNLLDKCDRLHRAGTARCWVIWPEKRKAWHYFANGIFEDMETLQCGDIEVAVAPLFSKLDD
jgi:Uma2 family endonuclease